MLTKEFAELAIEKGYTGNQCEGWEWIENNISLLDDIFKKEEYKQQKGMKYKCMPIILGNKVLTSLQEKALETAWYLNNKREQLTNEQAYQNKMLKEGWLLLTENIVKQAFNDKKRLQVNAFHSCDWLTRKVEEVYKPYIDHKGDCWLMKPNARSRGYYLHQFNNAFCKVI